MTDYQSKRYRDIYDVFISKLYDFGLKFGLMGNERILRMSVFDVVSPYIKRGDHVLDLCCGTGTLTALLAKLFYSDCKIVGVDLSSGQIAQAQKKNIYPNLEFKVMDANYLEFPNEIFDKVIISAALHEMDKVQRLNVLSEIYRVLKREGYFLIFDHHEPSKTFLRVLYNFYLGFSEKLFSKSAKMQRNILRELKESNFNILKQIPIKKFLSFFQIILTQK